jgi:hypothetical protein
MKPTRVKDIVSPLAHKHGLTTEQADQIVRAYWSFVREKLGEITHPRVLLPNLGTFTVKPWSLQKRITSVSRYIDYLLPQHSTSSYAILKEREKDYERLQQLQQLLDEELENKKAFKESKQA